jgi:hypothetical protein
VVQESSDCEEQSGVPDVWSLGLIGNASGKNSDNEVELYPRRFR